MVLVVGVTGFLSHAAYGPDLGMNAIVPRDDDLDLLLFTWPTSPSWLYALNQGTHVTLGIVAIPVLLAKLWSVIPRLFAWPPVRSPAQALERLVLAVLVGSALFEFATGVVNVQIYYPFRFNFVQAHYFGAWLFLGALGAHVAIKLPTIRRAYRECGVLRPLRASLAETRPEPHDPDGGLAPERPAAPTLSRRGLLGFVGGASALLFVVTAGQSIGGPLRRLAVLAPRNQAIGPGPGDFPVNKTAAAAGIGDAMVGPGYRLELVVGERAVTLSREDLLAMPLATHNLPIACVEGWSTTQRWTGVPLAALARRAGAPAGARAFVESLQEAGVLREATLNAGQVADARSLLALRHNGADLTMDHGFPARVIVPALPGVHNTKWVARITFL
jgi:DMSO/TMAO reductase YedYZ molybdopterin-dependent catalytic subunit